MFCKGLRACNFGPSHRMTKAKRGCPFCVTPNISKIGENALTEFEGLRLDHVRITLKLKSRE